MRRLTTLLPFLFLACGRGPTVGLGGFTDDTGVGPDGNVADVGVIDTGARDASVRDTGGGRDATLPDGFVPDADVQCNTPRDCNAAFGAPPFCPNGMPGRWLCNGGFCGADCPCVSDCECPLELACIAGACAPAGRRNLCCTNPDCPPGAFCQTPFGGGSMCPQSPPDGGPGDGGRRDGGRDGGFRPDGSFMPDSGVFPDGGFTPDTGADGGFFPDSGLLPDASVPDSGVGTPVGDPCAAQGLCGPAGFCIEESNGFPDGYCSQACGPSGQSCPSGAVCRNFGPGQQLCLDDCVSNNECRAGYACVQLGTNATKVCWPVDPGSTNPNGAPVGGACGDNQDCDSGLSCLQFMGWPGGYCTKQFCDPQNNPCPNGAACFAFSGVFSLCLDDCPSGGTQSTCRNGYYCLGPISQPGGCVPN